MTSYLKQNVYWRYSRVFMSMLGRMISQTKTLKIKYFLPFNFAITKICVAISLAENGTRMGGIQFRLSPSILKVASTQKFEIQSFSDDVINSLGNSKFRSNFQFCSSKNTSSTFSNMVGSVFTYNYFFTWQKFLKFKNKQFLQT